jgi:hypothetical protein
MGARVGGEESSAVQSCGGSLFGNVGAKVTHELGKLGSTQITLFAG